MFTGNQELNMEPGFIAQATANSRLFIDAYNELVKVYPDSRQNFEVKLTKVPVSIYYYIPITVLP
jgi:hypothetical protein